jgi:hypothetical protein
MQNVEWKVIGEWRSVGTLVNGAIRLHKRGQFLTSRFHHKLPKGWKTESREDGQYLTLPTGWKKRADWRSPESKVAKKAAKKKARKHA